MLRVVLFTNEVVAILERERIAQEQTAQASRRTGEVEERFFIQFSGVLCNEVSNLS
ncbi:MAG: hypothetical protein AAF938_10185 [Myxococcota bacterium]